MKGGEVRIQRSRVNPAAKSSSALTDQILGQIRSEYTVMPRFMFHQPLDYDKVSYPKKPIQPNRCSPLVPSDEFRFGYAPGDEEKYLAWGSYDANLILEEIQRAGLHNKDLKILDFGCSSGRVMRHFGSQIEDNNWRVYGCDIQATAIESMRADNWSDGFEFFTSTTIPHLPFEDNSLDVIYSFSVFTHTKYLWDAWLLELKRVLKPNGLMLHTVHLEAAWKFYHSNRDEKWVQESQAPEVYNTPSMQVDFLFDGDASVSQVFWKEEVLKNYWSRHFASLEVLPPAAEYSFQNRVVLRK
jgi:SAM-dependent methyltransferase